MFNKVTYRRGVIEGVTLYTLGRLGALITPAFFPDWVYVAAPLLFLVLQYLLGQILTVVVVGAVAVGVYLSGVSLLRVEEIGLMKGIVLARLGRRNKIFL